jgi:hypothetical protein
MRLRPFACAAGQRSASDLGIEAKACPGAVTEADRTEFTSVFVNERPRNAQGTSEHTSGHQRRVLGG